MKSKVTQRSLHLWAGAILSIPILIVGLTAVFIAHKDSLGTKQVALGSVPLPGYSSALAEMHGAEARSYFQSADGREWLGTKAGLFVRAGESFAPVEALHGVEVRALAVTGSGLVAATKMGLYREQDGAWTQTHKGDYWTVSARGDGTLVATSKMGLMQSADAGASWQPAKSLNLALAALPSEVTAEAMTLDKLVMDLHTGKAFLGKEYEWLWIDLVGIACAGLALTGLVLWRRGRRQKLAMDAPQDAAAPLAAAPPAPLRQT